MYFVDVGQIEARLEFLPVIVETGTKLAEAWNSADRIHVFAQERLLHLAVETVTDVGSLLIDGFLMRDASSYEDIVDILRGEGVLEEALAERLTRLVKLRKALVQDYMLLDAAQLHPYLAELPDVLGPFAQAVSAFLSAQF